MIGPYRPPWWLPGGNAQTIYAALGVQRPRPRYHRSEWSTPDRDRIVVDWLDHDSSEGGAATVRSARPLVVLFHGLEGGSGSHYAQSLMVALAAQGWRGAVPHFRGCGGISNRLPRAYHSGDAAEIDWILRRFADHAGDGPLFAVGVSLGGNALLKWLGEQADAAAQVVRAASAVSAPMDLAGAGEALSSGFNRVYTRMFLATMKQKALRKLELFPALYDAERLKRARTLGAFDDLVTAPLHGFKDYRDYWERASAKPHLHRISVPTLLINARNDPFLPDRHLPDPAELSTAITAEFPPGGGHAGFVSGPFPGRLEWLPQRIIGFFRSKAPAHESPPT